MINVFTQTKFGNSFETEISTNHTFLALRGFFENPENFARKSATHYSSLKFYVDDEFLPKNDTLQVSCESSDYLSPYSAIISQKDPSAGQIKIFHDSISTHLIPQNVWHSRKKVNLQKKSITQYFINLSLKNKMIRKTNLSTSIPHKSLAY